MLLKDILFFDDRIKVRPNVQSMSNFNRIGNYKNNNDLKL
jgi:hypothetical protein